ncbi:MAG: GAF domain-containing protein, partial [Thiovulaceae bacterium]|nr:GAF domain-containing protein [Sulfurimonadaceae bacterium]
MELQALRDKISDYEALIEKQRNHINTLHEIGTALSAENNLAKLLDMILEEAKKFTNADGGTLYLVTEDAQSLQFDAVHTDSLNIRMGGKHGAITWPPLPLYKDDGSPNKEMVAALCAIEGRVINIPDVYQAEGFNFDGPKQFDKANNYLTKSMLVVPMKNYEDEVIGVVQLINATDPKTKEFISFGEDYERSTLSLTSQAAIVITNVRLINDLRELLESFIKSIASAIDAKSPYTGGHVRKVAEISMLIANELNEVDEGHYKNVKYNDDELNQIRIAALMHDVGKITTPEYVMDKSTKLETIYDRIETVITKMELFRRDKKIAFLEAKMSI